MKHFAPQTVEVCEACASFWTTQRNEMRKVFPLLPLRLFVPLRCSVLTNSHLKFWLRLWRAVRSICLSVGILLSGDASAASPPSIVIEHQADHLEIKVGGQRFASYVFRDEKIQRPYFANVMTPDGIQVTRRHPPHANDGSSDHATMHPGIWLAFGDLSGADFWRNKAHVEHVRFVQKPATKHNHASFTVLNRYRKGDRIICTQSCLYKILAKPDSTVLLIDSTFQSDNEFYFGDQEEMGLGVRVTDAIRVKGGNGRISNSEGRVNERQVWGKQAQWCDYSGVINKHRVGMLLVPSQKNFRPSWFHARDYGALVANPFGRKAFTRGTPSKVVVKPGEKFRLRFAVVIYSVPETAVFDLSRAYQDAAKIIE